MVRRQPGCEDYVLGRDDQLSVDVLNLELIGPQPIRSDTQDNINGALAAPDYCGWTDGGSYAIEPVSPDEKTPIKTYHRPLQV
jgi:hypothetical protein